MKLRWMLLLACSRLLWQTLLAVDAPSPAPAMDDNNPRILFPPATVNGQPASFIWDTGSRVSWLRDDAARRLNLKLTTPPDRATTRLQGAPIGFTDPLHVTFGGNDFTAPFLVLPWNSAVAAPFDGGIGWAETKDNILVFDPVRRTVTRVERLPPETSTWLKWKIHPAIVLTLEIPLPQGSPGLLVVDTGSIHGVALSPFRWFVFQHDHPNAPVNNTAYFGVTGSFHRPQSWADEIALGPLTLTSVPVVEANDYEIATLGDFYGTLGLAALARLDLVVDGPGGFAYLRPRPALKDAKPTTGETQNWQVAGPWKISPDALYAHAAEAHASLGISKNDKEDFEGAIVECNRALELDPKNPHARAGLVAAYVSRAVSKSRNGDLAGARADVGHALALDPKNADALTLLNQLNLPAAK